MINMWDNLSTVLHFSTQKRVLIRDWRLGLALRALQTLVVVYALLRIFFNLEYLSPEVPSNFMVIESKPNEGFEEAQETMWAVQATPWESSRCGDVGLRRYDYTHSKGGCAACVCVESNIGPDFSWGAMSQFLTERCHWVLVAVFGNFSVTACEALPSHAIGKVGNEKNSYMLMTARQKFSEARIPAPRRDMDPASCKAHFVENGDICQTKQGQSATYSYSPIPVDRTLRDLEESFGSCICNLEAVLLETGTGTVLSGQALWESRPAHSEPKHKPLATNIRDQHPGGWGGASRRAALAQVSRRRHSDHHARGKYTLRTRILRYITNITIPLRRYGGGDSDHHARGAVAGGERHPRPLLLRAAQDVHSGG
eukprot:1194963-Prorocentrum_minimum.AAC.3